MNQTKPFNIPKQLIFDAYKRVKANKGSAGVDAQSLADFEQDLKSNLYKLWNRMSSGSYFPQAVKRVEVPKADGKTRPLGIPTVADRIAQMVVKMQIEPELEAHFHDDSYGYRPNKSAQQAVMLVKQRCWQRPWVLDMDIKGFFDNIDHDLLLKAVDKHVTEKWHQLYIVRLLQAPVQYSDGTMEHKGKGTPQGGVISPLLANLFLHYVFDVWMKMYCKDIQFVRYADDIICHCTSEQEVEQLHTKLLQRFTECGLTLHPEKTKIVYCKSWKHTADFKCISFDFLGFTFCPKLIKCRSGKFLVGFIPEVSRKAAKRIRAEINSWSWQFWVQREIKDILIYSQSKLRGWVEYYGKVTIYSIKWVLQHFNRKLSRWAKRKYKSLKNYAQAMRRVIKFQRKHPGLLAHW
ncbi:group II intron reverse transcriptase/maturase [Thiotrichales bacterium HSG1]|nr:group II intron reverse transcriptase/maturase [Thiotrichales bacterium HSG1]